MIASNDWYRSVGLGWTDESKTPIFDDRSFLCFDDTCISFRRVGVLIIIYRIWKWSIIMTDEKVTLKQRTLLGKILVSPSLFVKHYKLFRDKDKSISMSLQYAFLLWKAFIKGVYGTR